MSFIETVKELGTVVIGAVKENPAVAIAAVVGTVVVGYGAHRTVKYVRSRPAKLPAPAVAAVVVEATPAEATAAAVAAAAQVALLSLTRAEADNMGVLDDWCTALKVHLRSKQAK